MAEKRAQFGTKIGVLMATVGSAVGLGNIWRFPYECGNGGGAAFLVVYIAFVFLLGVPAICAEFSLGRSSRKGMPLSFRVTDGSRRWDILGYASIIAAFMILAFYAVVAGWTLEYIMDSVTGLFKDTPNSDRHAQFASFVSGWRAVGWALLFLLINALVMTGGVVKGIERVSNILTPLLFLLLIVFSVNSLLMPGAAQGLEFMFKPDFSKLTTEVVLGALGQAFFSLSLGMGCLVTYSSYFSDDTPLVKTAMQISVLDTLVAVMAGVIIFPAVFSFGMSPAEGPTLVFEVLPNIFHNMPGGSFWSFLFFVLLALASLTSIISVSEIVVAFLCDCFGMTRIKATCIVTGISLVTATLCSLSFGSLAELNRFNIFDFLSSNVLLPLGGMGLCVFVGWRMKRSAYLEQMKRESGVPAFVFDYITIGIRFVAPACILTVFIAGLL